MSVVKPPVEGRRILVGVVGAPHGIRGEARIKSYMQVPTAIGGRTAFTAAAGGGSVTILSVRPLKDDMVVGRLADVTTREAAAALTGQPLYIERAALGPTEDDEFYHADLVGLAARTVAGDALGHVVGVVNYGGGDLLEIETGGPATTLVPFLKRFVPVVDIGGGFVAIAPEALASEEDDEASGAAAP